MKKKKNKAEYDYRGFNLKSVTWGYRDIFKTAIDNLYKEKLLGKENNESTAIFFDLLKKSSTCDSCCYDHILKNFITSLNYKNNWILKIPSLMSDWTELGYELSEHKIFMGLSYFQIWGDGGFGNTPEDVSYVLNKARELKVDDIEFAYNFIFAYKKLCTHLNNHEINIFIDNAKILLNRNRKNALAFLKLETKTSLLYIQSISHEGRLQDIRERLIKYARGIAGRIIKLENMGNLDADELIERGSLIVITNDIFYFPERVSFYGTKKENIDFYLLITAVSAACYYFKSFPLIHGLKGASSSLKFIKNKKINNSKKINNYFIIFETYRILSFMLKHFPGISNIFREVVKHEIVPVQPDDPFDKLLYDSMKNLAGFKVNDGNHKIIKIMKDVTGKCDTFIEIIKFLENLPDSEELNLSANNFVVSPLTFFPDFMFSVTISDVPELSLSAKLNELTKHEKEGDETDQEKQPEKIGDYSENVSKIDENQKEANKGFAGYFYNEWSSITRDYMVDWCCLREKIPQSNIKLTINLEYKLLSKQVKKVFEKLKPEQVRKEKFLPQGDNINIDQLVNYISLKKAKFIEQERFYEKPLVRKRDLAVAILIDMSGSTGEVVENNKKVIDMEKESAFILAEGLTEIGDQFGIFGFTGNGRENAEYYIFKEFQEKWEDKSQQALFSATPKSSTRIGVALRHTGEKLFKMQAKKKLIIIITDGKPMDNQYDNNNRYAQHDVRKANEENLRKGIDSFCISTEENKIEDLEIMFSMNHYVIIKSMKDLPKILSLLYLKLTT